MNRVRNTTQVRERHAPKSQRCVPGPELRVSLGAERGTKGQKERQGPDLRRLACWVAPCGVLLALRNMFKEERRCAGGFEEGLTSCEETS